VQPYSVGRVIFATWRPHEAAVLEIIQSLGIEYHIIFNKRAVMVLPSGVNKATGLKRVLKRLNLSPHQVVGIGDAENDHAFLESCAVAAAVSNALPALQERCDLVMQRDHGGGVVELIDRLLADDLQGLGVRRPRKEIAASASQPTTSPHSAESAGS
jgi:hydroxymethylpyrimidine pyrophosphatase-like HAD family hydrolase